jgi:putative membrane protein
MNWWQLHGDQVVSALVFSAIGMVAFALFFFLLPRVLPFSLKKEILEDENTALGIVIGAIVLGMAFIIGQAVG